MSRFTPICSENGVSNDQSIFNLYKNLKLIGKTLMNLYWKSERYTDQMLRLEKTLSLLYPHFNFEFYFYFYHGDPILLIDYVQDEIWSEIRYSLKTLLVNELEFNELEFFDVVNSLILEFTKILEEKYPDKKLKWQL